jgi:hypothetical protein
VSFVAANMGYLQRCMFAMEEVVIMGKGKKSKAVPLQA